MTTHDIRQKYLDFFKERGHVIVPSAPLVPENDPTTLFTGSGMQPMVPYLLGEPHPEGTRIADSQKCFRTEEFEEVGDNRHTTFFEMLGNWSFGDYFKAEQIPWMFEFVTGVLGVDPGRLYISVYRGNEEFGLPRDDEAVTMWKSEFTKVGIDARDVDFAERSGMQDGRIFYYPDEKNWWSRTGVPSGMPVGEPGGPDSELFYDFGPSTSSGQALHDVKKFGHHCHVNCDCGRFMEFGNNVFMTYRRANSGFEELPKKNIDFGGGLERIAAVVQRQQDMFMIDVFDPVREIVEHVSGKTYGEDEKNTFAFRVIMDHLRAATHLVGDRIVPSNKDQGYFSRRLIRRAVRFAHVLGVSQNFAGRVTESVIASYAHAYPVLVERKEEIVQEIDQEESKFRVTLEKGLREFERVRSRTTGTFISGKDAFDLYQTYGFPIEMILEIAEEEGTGVDVAGFEAEFEKEKQKHQDVSRAGAEQKFKGGLADHGEETTKLHTATHLLHAALRAVLGPHVEQRGSNITGERLRFDFTHPAKMTEEEKQHVEDLVNQAIKKDYPVSYHEMTVEEAKEKGAIGLFEERYGAKVKVYSVGDSEAPVSTENGSLAFSREICGGPHVEHTGVIGKFRITKEEASSAGVRRVKAVVE